MIELRDVSHRYLAKGRKEMTVTSALEEVTLTVPRRQFLAVVGSSGSGKTTLLRLVAGLMKPMLGRVVVDGQPVLAPGRDRAMVFQQGGLYPWHTGAGNVR